MGLAEASNWLRRLDFDPEGFLRRRTWNLPMGAKRITEVIAALAAPACLYVLDEPTAGLDGVRRGKLAELLCELSQRRPLLVATQDREWLTSMGVMPLEITQGVGV
jgi:atypical dual specificity phosphatase